MILYHGSTDVVEVPRIILSESGRDFGTGFYTTDIRQQAIKWAIRLAKIRSKNKNNITPILNAYEFDKKAFEEINVKHYEGYTMEWLELIVSCRSNNNFSHEFDIVTGRIADDDVGQTVQTVVDGLVPKEYALSRLTYMSANNQICFYSDTALRYLKFTGYEIGRASCRERV